MEILKAKKFNSFEEFDFKPGSYVIMGDNNDILMTLPCGHNFRPDGKWQITDPQDETKITLNPSIFCSPQVPCWHGYLTNGEFKKC